MDTIVVCNRESATNTNGSCHASHCFTAQIGLRGSAETNLFCAIQSALPCCSLDHSHCTGYCLCLTFDWLLGVLTHTHKVM